MTGQRSRFASPRTSAAAGLLFTGLCTPLGNGKVVFQADDGTTSAGLWSGPDGTAAGTTLVKDIYSERDRLLAV